VPGKKTARDPKAIESARKNFCQVCGRYQESGLHVHHVKSKGSGGDDSPDNLVTLCYECHTKVHAGEITLDGLMILEMPPLEHVLQIFVDAKESEESSRWAQAAALVILRDGLKIKPAKISSMVGISPALVREMTRTFNVFHDEGTRVPELSFYHHRLASATDDPFGWIARAADEGWSTRQMADEIKKSGSVSEKARRDHSRSRAEKALRLTKEVLDECTDASEWLAEELSRLLILAKAG